MVVVVVVVVVVQSCRNVPQTTRVLCSPFDQLRRLLRAPHGGQSTNCERPSRGRYKRIEGAWPLEVWYPGMGWPGQIQDLDIDPWGLQLSKRRKLFSDPWLGLVRAGGWRGGCWTFLWRCLVKSARSGRRPQAQSCGHCGGLKGGQNHVFLFGEGVASAPTWRRLHGKHAGRWEAFVWEARSFHHSRSIRSGLFQR